MYLALGGLIGIIVFAMIGGVLIAREGAKKADAKQLPNGQRLDPEYSGKLKQASKDVRAARNNAYRIQNLGLRGVALDALDKAEKVVTEMNNQPEEIRRSTQFFNYYIPTISVVLEKYLALEGSGNLEADTAEKTAAYLNEMGTAFEKQYNAMFKDEALDLTVEIEAMQKALKRDVMTD